MMKRPGRILVYWLPPVAWAGAIFVVSSLSLPPQPPVYPFEDKVYHALVFGVLALLLLRAFFEGQQISLARAALLAFILASLYGVVDEVHQYFVPLRTMDVRDWLADTAGAAVSFVAAALSSRGRRGKLGAVDGP